MVTLRYVGSIQLFTYQNKHKLINIKSLKVVLLIFLKNTFYLGGFDMQPRIPLLVFSCHLNMKQFVNVTAFVYSKINVST